MELLPIIKNYGLFWRREDVFWGRQSCPGTLLGRNRARLIDPPVDFREQKAIYVLYDSGYEIVYIGQSGNGAARLWNRLNYHRTHNLAQRWTNFSWFGLLEVADGDTTRLVGRGNQGPSVYRLEEGGGQQNFTHDELLNGIEAILIASVEPPHNRKGGIFQGAAQFLQERDPILGLTTEQMILAIYNAREQH